MWIIRLLGFAVLHSTNLLQSKNLASDKKVSIVKKHIKVHLPIAKERRINAMHQKYSLVGFSPKENRNIGQNIGSRQSLFSVAQQIDLCSEVNS